MRRSEGEMACHRGWNLNITVDDAFRHQTRGAVGML